MSDTAPHNPPAPTLWLQRHARPLIAPGTCYGRTNMAADDKATADAASGLIGAWREAGLAPGVLWHSPLQRCEQLALAICALEPYFAKNAHPGLVEMDFGDWEGQRWDDIDRSAIDAWTRDFVHHAPGGGESLALMMERVAAALDAARAYGETSGAPVLWITHAGVIQCAHWLLTRAEREPTAKDWPSVKVAVGDWLRLSLR